MKQILLFTMIFAATLAQAQIPTDNLEAHYPFNGNANDESGNLNDGTVEGATLTTDRFGNQNQAYFFDGIDDWINLGDSATLHHSDSSTNSLSLWFKSNSDSTEYQNLLRYDDRDAADGDNANPRNVMALRIINLDGDMDYDLQYTFGQSDPATPRHISHYSSDDYTINNWHHVVAIKDDLNDSVYLYMDGVEVLAKEDSSMGSWETTGQYLMLGRYLQNTLNEFFSGSIDDVRIYSDVLNECEVWSLFKEGEGVFDLSVSQTNNTLMSNETSGTYQWIDCSDNSIIAGETNPSYTATSNGNYAVVLNNGVCSDTSSCFDVSNVGIRAINSSNLDYKLFPNPTSSQVSITNFQMTIDNIQVIDVTGMVLQSYTPKSSMIDLSQLAEGIYFIKIEEKGEVLTQKIIKE